MSRVKILIIDDEQDILEIIKISLETHGEFIVKSATSAQEALKEAPIFNPDLILLDFFMPDIVGVELFKELRALPPLSKTPFVMLTGVTNSEKIKEFLNLGITDVIVKPFDPWTLPKQILQVLHRNGEKQ